MTGEVKNAFEANLDFAKRMDQEDELNNFSNRFFIPERNGSKVIYFCGNSLGLQPKNVKSAIEQELCDWQELVVDGYWQAKNPWLYYQHTFNEPLSKITGALPSEVTVMNSLTVNLHLMMLSFYRPDKQHYKIIMEAGAFPSDQYAVHSQVRHYGFDPAEAVIEVKPRAGEYLIRQEDILETIDKHKDNLALVLFGGINYYTGQLFDIKGITEVTHKAGALAGFDLAHAVGNAPLSLHDWQVDFAVWCSYKYLNGGPGAVGGAFVHEHFGNNPDQHRMAGWWGNDEKTRFKMEPEFVPQKGANGWQVSTAQVFNMVALKASLEIFEKATFPAIRKKSEQLTAYLEYLLKQVDHIEFAIITSPDADKKGAQLSLFFKEKGHEIYEKMKANNIVIDYREPGVIRVAPAPLYNSFEDAYRFYEIVKNMS